jgi:FKBP-type peptidyl-prolyl cis-trans isomerase FkpA
MKRKITFFLLFLLILECSINAQQNIGKYPGYTRTPTGLYYKTLKTQPNAMKPELGDFVSIGMINKTHNDSVLFNSYTDLRTMGKPIQFTIGKPAYEGDFIEGIFLMGIGDSTNFYISADSFYLKILKLPDLPPFIQPGTDLSITIKLFDIISKKDFEKQQQDMVKKYNERVEIFKTEEPQKIKWYIDSSKHKFKPTASGLYYEVIKKGKGQKIENGDTISVHYTGKFVDGSIFDSSVGKNPVKFPIGAGLMIKGWEEGITYLKKGSKAVILIPSFLGYGEKGAGQLIPPYTPLVYEIEIMEVIKGPKKK